MEYFDVTLMKDNQGLGITIAGYVGKDNTPGRLKWGQCRGGGGVRPDSGCCQHEL